MTLRRIEAQARRGLVDPIKLAQARARVGHVVPAWTLRTGRPSGAAPGMPLIVMWDRWWSSLSLSRSRSLSRGEG